MQPLCQHPVKAEVNMDHELAPGSEDDQQRNQLVARFRCHEQHHRARGNRLTPDRGCRFMPSESEAKHGGGT